MDPDKQNPQQPPLPTVTATAPAPTPVSNVDPDASNAADRAAEEERQKNLPPLFGSLGSPSGRLDYQLFRSPNSWPMQLLGLIDPSVSAANYSPTYKPMKLDDPRVQSWGKGLDERTKVNVLAMSNSDADVARFFSNAQEGIKAQQQLADSGIGVKATDFVWNMAPYVPLSYIGVGEEAMAGKALSTFMSMTRAGIEGAGVDALLNANNPMYSGQDASWGFLNGFLTTGALHVIGAGAKMAWRSAIIGQLSPTVSPERILDPSRLLTWEDPNHPSAILNPNRVLPGNPTINAGFEPDTSRMLPGTVYQNRFEPDQQRLLGYERPISETGITYSADELPGFQHPNAPTLQPMEWNIGFSPDELGNMLYPNAPTLRPTEWAHKVPTLHAAPFAHDIPTVFPNEVPTVHAAPWADRIPTLQYSRGPLSEYLNAMDQIQWLKQRFGLDEINNRVDLGEIEHHELPMKIQAEAAHARAEEEAHAAAEQAEHAHVQQERLVEEKVAEAHVEHMVEAGDLPQRNPHDVAQAIRRAYRDIAPTANKKVTIERLLAHPDLAERAPDEVLEQLKGMGADFTTRPPKLEGGTAGQPKAYTLGKTQVHDVSLNIPTKQDVADNLRRMRERAASAKTTADLAKAHPDTEVSDKGAKILADAEREAREKRSQLDAALAFFNKGGSTVPKVNDVADTRLSTPEAREQIKDLREELKQAATEGDMDKVRDLTDEIHRIVAEDRAQNPTKSGESRKGHLDLERNDLNMTDAYRDDLERTTTEVQDRVTDTPGTHGNLDALKAIKDGADKDGPLHGLAMRMLHLMKQPWMKDLMVVVHDEEEPLLDGAPAGGWYDPEHHQIVLGKGADAQTVLHEYVHAFTTRWLYRVDENDPIYKEMQKLYQTVKDELAERRERLRQRESGRSEAALKAGIISPEIHFDNALDLAVRLNKFDSQYGMTDMHEFLAEAMTRPEFQTILDSIDYPEPTVSTAWGHLVKIVKSLVDKFTEGLGLGKSVSTSTLTHAMAAFKAISAEKPPAYKKGGGYNKGAEAPVAAPKPENPDAVPFTRMMRDQDDVDEASQDALAQGNYKTVKMGRDNIRLTRVFNPRETQVGREITLTAFNKKGEAIGYLRYSNREDAVHNLPNWNEPKRYNPEIQIRPAARGKGLASMLYDEAQKAGGKIPEIDQPDQVAERTAEGRPFRMAMEQKKNPGNDAYYAKLWDEYKARSDALTAANQGVADRWAQMTGPRFKASDRLNDPQAKRFLERKAQLNQEIQDSMSQWRNPPNKAQPAAQADYGYDVQRLRTLRQLNPDVGSGIGAPQSKAADIISSLRQEFGDGVDRWIQKGKLTVVQSFKDLPAALRMDLIRQRMHATSGIDDTDLSVKGLFTRDGKKVYLVADNINPEYARSTLIHEIGEHYGLGKMLGNEGYSNLTKEVQGLSLTDQRVADAFNYTRANYGDDNPRFWHEVIARLAGGARDLPVVQRIIAGIKQFMLQRGFRVKLTAGDVQQMLLNSTRRAFKEKLADEGKNPVPNLTSGVDPDWGKARGTEEPAEPHQVVAAGRFNPLSTNADRTRGPQISAVARANGAKMFGSQRGGLRTDGFFTDAPTVSRLTATEHANALRMAGGQEVDAIYHSGKEHWLTEQNLSYLQGQRNDVDLRWCRAVKDELYAPGSSGSKVARQAADRLKTFYAKRGEDMQKAGVAGMDGIQLGDYHPRVHDGHTIADARFAFGGGQKGVDALAAIWEDGFRRSGGALGMPNDLVTMIAQGYQKTLDAVHGGYDMYMGHGINVSDTNGLTAALIKQGFDPARVQKAIDLFKAAQRSKGDGSIKYTKHRLSLDTSTPISVPGMPKLKTIADLMEPDAFAAARKYNQTTGGATGAARVGWKDDKAFEDMMVESHQDMIAQKVNPTDQARYDRSMRAGWASLYNRPLTDDQVPEWKRISSLARSFFGNTVLGMAGAPIVAAATVRALGLGQLRHSLALMTDLLPGGALRSGSDGMLSGKGAREIQGVMDLGHDPVGAAMFDRDTDGTKMGDTLAAAQTAVNRFGQVVSGASGWGPIRNWFGMTPAIIGSKRLLVSAFTRRLVDNVMSKTGGDFDKNFAAWLGLTDKDAADIRQQIGKHSPWVAANGWDPHHELNLGSWDNIDARDRFIQAIRTFGDKAVHSDDIGARAPWMDTELGKWIMHLRAFPFMAMSKGLGSAVNMRNVQSAAEALLLGVAGWGEYMARTYAATGGMDDEQRQAFLAKRTGLDKQIAAFVGRNAYAGMYPAIFDTVGGGLFGKTVFDDIRSSGQSSSIMGTPIVTGLSNASQALVDAWHAGQGRFTQRDAKNVGTLAGSNMLGTTWLTNRLSQSLNAKAPRRSRFDKPTSLTQDVANEVEQQQ